MVQQKEAEEIDPDDYNFTVLWSKNRQVFIGKCTELPTLEAEGETEEEALEEIMDLVEFMFEDLDDEEEEQQRIEEIKQRNNNMIVKTNKVIGIVGWKTGDNSFGATIDYLDFANRFGNTRILMPYEKPEESNIDLLIVPGGADLSSSEYGQTPSYHNSNPDVFKDNFIKEKLLKYIEQGTSVFGICLGFQAINTVLGGGLVQHLTYHPQSSGRWQPAHRVYRVDLAPNLRTDKNGFEVNSHHHQAVTLNTLASDLQPLLLCDNDDAHLTGDLDIVESFRHKELKIAGCQYHTEQWLDGHSIQLMNWLLGD
ncbi:MAG: gamma-glutamyl-gamma-aminobutyrate hydrolase family protein [Ignavibacteria bacterium]|nr:gamma-glutamyl-gamma-aminobutyrate hydrolase family protein [Ignavibacteria bacterium]